MTDPTRPVRDQIAEAVRSFEPSEYEGSPNMQARWRCSVADAVLDLPAIADALAAAAERDALRATVDRVRDLLADWDAWGQAWRDDTTRLAHAADDLRRALDGATQAAPRPGHAHLCHPDDPACAAEDAPAAQGVPLTEEAQPRCQHLSPSPWGTAQCALADGHEERHAYSPSEALTEDPQR